MNSLSTELYFKIMLTLDINDIVSICQSDNIIHSICEDDYFWKLKFAQDQLPIIEPPFYSWITLYQMTLQAKKDVTHLLTIQESDPNTPYIFVEGPEKYVYQHLGMLSKKHSQNVIRIHKNGNYIFSFKPSKNEIFDENQAGIILTKQETLDFLMKIRYYQIFDRFNNQRMKYYIADYNNIPFLVTNETLEDYKYSDNKEVLLKRHKMLNDLLFIEYIEPIIANIII